MSILTLSALGPSVIAFLLIFQLALNEFGYDPLGSEATWTLALGPCPLVRPLSPFVPLPLAPLAPTCPLAPAPWPLPLGTAATHMTVESGS